MHPLQPALPAWLENVPAWHDRQAVLLALGAYSPAEQRTHRLGSAMPVPVENDPALQAVHAVLAMPRPDEYAPVPQNPHWPQEDRPVPTQYRPASARVQAPLEDAPTDVE